MATGRSGAEAAIVSARRAKLIRYRRDGRQYRDIYEELGYATPSAASKDFKRALEENLTEQRMSIEVYRETELLRLDGELERLTRLYAKVERILDKFHVTVQFGKVIDIDGEPLEDDGPALAAVDRLVKIEDARRRNSERRSKLLGLDAAQKVEMTIDDIDAKIHDLNEQLAALDGEAAEAPGAEAPPG